VRRLQRKIGKKRLIRILLRVEEADKFVGIKLVRVNTDGTFYDFSVAVKVANVPSAGAADVAE